MTTVRIDCGSGVAAGPHHTHSIFKNLLPVNVIAAAEQQTLLPKEATSSPGRPTDVALRRASMIVALAAYCTCALVCIALIVVLALLYNRVNDALAAVDGSVPLTSTVATMLKNVNSALNFTAAVTKETSVLMAKAHTPLLSTLNSTRATLLHVERLAQNPTVSLG